MLHVYYVVKAYLWRFIYLNMFWHQILSSVLQRCSVVLIYNYKINYKAPESTYIMILLLLQINMSFNIIKGERQPAQPR